jgi:hypothetical protein
MYNRNEVVCKIVLENKEANRPSTHVFNAFTGKIYSKVLFAEEAERFDKLHEDDDIQSWYVLHDMWHMNCQSYPMFNPTGKYIGAKMGIYGVLSKEEINKQWVKKFGRK